MAKLNWEKQAKSRIIQEKGYTYVESETVKRDKYVDLDSQCPRSRVTVKRRKVIPQAITLVSNEDKKKIALLEKELDAMVPAIKTLKQTKRVTCKYLQNRLMEKINEIVKIDPSYNERELSVELKFCIEKMNSILRR